MAVQGTGRGRAQRVDSEDFTIASSAPPLGDYKLTVDLVASVNERLGALTEAVKTLKEQSKSHGEKLEAIGKDVHGAKVGLQWSVAVFVGAVAILGWLLRELIPLIPIHLVR